MKKIIAAIMLGLALAATPAFSDDEPEQTIVARIVQDDEGNAFYIFDEENMNKLNAYLQALRDKAGACTL